MQKESHFSGLVVVTDKINRYTLSEMLHNVLNRTPLEAPKTEIWPLIITLTIDTGPEFNKILISLYCNLKFK